MCWIPTAPGRACVLVVPVVHVVTGGTCGTCGTCGHRWYLCYLWYLWYLWSPQVTQVPPMTTCTTGTTSTTGATGTTGGEQLCVLQTTDPRRPPPHHRFPPELLPQTTARATHMPYPRRISGGLARVPRSPARPHGDHRSTPRPPSCGPHAMRRHPQADSGT